VIPELNVTIKKPWLRESGEDNIEKEIHIHQQEQEESLINAYGNKRITRYAFIPC